MFQIIDIINLFKQPELTRTLPGFALIKKKQLLDVRKGFKWEQNNFYYLMPDGSFSETADNEKVADFKITHMKYFLRDDPEKKMSLMIVLCKNSQLGQDIFGTHLLTQFYHEFAPEESQDNRIRCVDSFEELIKFLGEFTETKKVSNSKGPLTKALQAISESRKGPYVKSNLSQDRSSKIKTSDVIPYFTKPELLDELSDFNWVSKDQVNDVLNNFRYRYECSSYLMPDGSVSRSGSVGKKSAFFIITKKCYFSKEDVNMKVFVTTVSSNNPQQHQKNFDTHVITQLLKNEAPQLNITLPIIKNGCIKSLESDLSFRLKDFEKTYNAHIPITKRDKSQKYVHTRKNPTAKIEYSEYSHSVENDIKAITTKITCLFDSVELKKFENKTLLQMSSSKKQKLFYLTDILDKMKSFEETEEDFSIMNFSDIESDNNLKKIKVDNKKFYNRTSEGFEKIKVLHENSLPIDLLCQKYQFEPENEQNVKYYVFRIHQTTDKELEQFVGKALVQKVDERHQIVTKPNDIIKYMMSDVV